MAVKRPNKYLPQDTPQIFVYMVALILPRSATLVYKPSIPTLTFLEWIHYRTLELWGELAHCQARRTCTSLWDVRGEPAMGSIVDFGPRPGDWTLKFSSMGYNWKFVTCLLPNLSTRHSWTIINQALSHLTCCHAASFTHYEEIENTPQCFCYIGLVL